MTATDQATGKEQKVRIEASSGLSDAEIDRMVKQAEIHRAEDQARKEKVEARNNLDSLIYQVEKDTEEWGDKVSEEVRERIDGALEKGRQALKDDDTTAINQARDELMQAFTAAGAEMYQAQAAEAQADAGDDGAETGDFGADEVHEDADAEARAADDDVIEADYEIVDEGK